LAENVERNQSHPRRPLREQSMSSQTPLGSVVCQEILTENLNMRRIAHHDNAPTQTFLKTTEFVTNNNMVIVPHSPYSPDLAPVISHCFPN
jgi:hypothetical protein